MSNEVEIVVKARDETSAALKSAEANTSKYGHSVGAVGESADGSERNLIGLHDVIDGTSTIMQGPGKAGIAAYIQGWADLAGGIAPLLSTLSKLTLATIKDTASKIANTASTVANAIATKAAAIASGIWTAAQWLLNAAMSANPIGIVILAIIALVAIIILIARKTTWFQTIWKALWGFMKAVGAWFAGPFAGFFVSLWNRITAVNNGIRNAFINGFRAVVNFVRGVPGKLWSFFASLPGRYVSLGSAIIHGIIRGIGGAVGALKNAVANAAKHALNAAKNFLGIHSPSTVFRDQVGKQMAAGQVEGYMAGMSGMTSAVGSASSSAAGAVGGGGQGGGGAVPIQLAGNTDSVFATMFQKLINDGKITIPAKIVVAR